MSAEQLSDPPNPKAHTSSSSVFRSSASTLQALMPSLRPRKVMPYLSKHCRSAWLAVVVAVLVADDVAVVVSVVVVVGVVVGVVTRHPTYVCER